MQLTREIGVGIGTRRPRNGKSGDHHYEPQHKSCGRYQKLPRRSHIEASIGSTATGATVTTQPVAPMTLMMPVLISSPRPFPQPNPDGHDSVSGRGQPPTTLFTPGRLAG
jgi:hypothetical protein